MNRRFIPLVIFVIGLIYVLLPGAGQIEDFQALPGSTVSKLDGDTWQNPNIVAYFSDYDRKGITEFYRKEFNSKLFSLPSIRVNHPPENAKVFVRDQQESTFLEEYIYPLRGSLYVNGYEPAVQNVMFKRESCFVCDHLHYDEKYFASKTTLRYYPTGFVARLLNYLLIWFGVVVLWKLTKRAIKESP